MSMDKGFPIQTLIVYEASLDGTFDVDPRDDTMDIGPNPIEELIKLQLGPKPGQNTQLYRDLTSHQHRRIADVLHRNTNLFVWHPSDMLGIHPRIICHKLAIYPQAKPVLHKMRKMGEERHKTIKEEVDKLLKAQFIKEVKYSTWLANVVMVKKANGKWRMCTNYIDLNRVCPKDAYPLPNIDRLVNNASGFQVLSFLDAYSGYNQIKMPAPNEEKTTFITEDVNFCYRVMPFGLKNTGTTYQRLLDWIFKQQIRGNVEVYVDDMVVKSQRIFQHLANLEKVFGEIRKYDMWLNPEKCTFGVCGRKFLGFLITHRGIEANLDKCIKIQEMHNPTSVEEVQKLNDRPTSLSRFLPQLAEKEKPFYKLLRKTEPFLWDKSREQASLAFKKTIATPSFLIWPRPGVPLLLYLSLVNEAVSSALVQEDRKHQIPIYFTSRILHNVEKWH